MRQTCTVRYYREDDDDLLCGKPAVDFIDGEDGKKHWLCADHFDLLQRIHRIMQEREDRDYKFRPPKPGKEID